MKFLFLSILGLFLSCGEEKWSPYPSRQNSPQWLSSWKEGHWILFSRKSLSLTELELKRKLQFAFQNSSLSFWDGVNRFPPHFRLSLLKSHPQSSHSIALLNFDSKNFLEILSFSSQKFSSSFKLQQLQVQWDLLEEALSDWSWIEPDLEESLRLPKFENRPTKTREKKKEPISLSLEEEGSQGNSESLLRNIPPDFIEGTQKIYERINLLPVREQLKTILKENPNALSEIHVAIMDTGVDAFHPYLINRMFVDPRYADDLEHLERHGINATNEEGLIGPNPGSGPVVGSGQACLIDIGDPRANECIHGTHVAGLVAADFGLGVCSSCKIISIRATNRIPVADKAGQYLYSVDGGIQDSSQIKGLQYLYNLRWPDRPDHLVVNAVNMSLGKIFWSRTMAFLIRLLTNLGVSIFAAAGNENVSLAMFPAAYEPVTAVAALGDDANLGYRGIYAKAPFSNFGSWVNLSAPGTNILSTVPGLTGLAGHYDVNHGTSMATPLVTGAYGLLKSFYGEKLSSSELKARLLKSAHYEKVYSDPKNAQIYKQNFSNRPSVHLLGTGLLDVQAAFSDSSQTPFEDFSSAHSSGGCVLSNISGTRSFFKSDHFLLFFLILFGILRKKRRRMKPIQK